MMTEPDSSPAHPVLLFDGYCNLCNFWANFLLAADSKHNLKFATQQSSVGQQLLLQHGHDSAVLESVILIDREDIFVKSSAVLQVLRQLGGVWKFFYIMIIVPRPLRDFFYDVVARNRYRWFGKREHCRIPSAPDRERFLD